MQRAVRDILPSAGAGAVFGAVLTASRVHLPAVIVDQMRLTDFHMLEVFVTACASSAVVMAAFETLGLAKRNIRLNAPLNLFFAFDGNIIGGLLLGIGMGLTGACPGTVLPQLVERVPSSYFVALGGLFGGLTHAKYGNHFRRASSDKGGEPSIRHTIGSRFGLPKGLDLLLFLAVAIAVVTFSARSLPGKSQTMLPTTTSGLLIGFAQAVSLLATAVPLGVSSAYSQVGQYIWRLVGSKDVPKPQNPPRSILFALGILLGSMGMKQYLSLPIPAATTASNFQSIFGGFLLVLGARIAGGCTSGHGISGLAAMSYASLLTTAAMFAGGIAIQIAQ